MHDCDSISDFRKTRDIFAYYTPSTAYDPPGHEFEVMVIIFGGHRP